MTDAVQHDGWVQHPVGVRRSKGLAVPQDEPSLFAQATSVPIREVVGMVHGNDPIESQAAAVRAKPTVEELRRRILHYVALHGPHTPLEMEECPEFADAGRYNVRRRCSDLTTSGRAVRRGTRGGSGLIDIPPTEKR